MEGLAEERPPFMQLRSMSNTTYLMSAMEMLETQEGRTVLLIQSRPERSTPPEELVLRVQGFVLQADLPPIRRNQYAPFTLPYAITFEQTGIVLRLPANPSRLIDLHQSVTIGGLEAPPFADAVSGVLAIYEHFKLHLRSHNLRSWKPGQEGTYLTLTDISLLPNLLKESLWLTSASTLTPSICCDLF
ncbi:hypothetical protein BV20DRAFT_1053918 [Pilatotrama ljubarskyi]|nr:hypothetical protein BV20DRAFT_1053918 [Pilatotrama ljubarskyi]